MDSRRLVYRRGLWEIPHVKTLKADARKRVRLPDARPHQVFSYVRHAGRIELIEVKESREERFPRGSLLKFMTKERDALELALVRGCVQGPA